MKNFRLTALIPLLLLLSLSDCKKKNSELSFQDQINSIHNLNLVQHTLNNLTMSYLRAIHDSVALATNMSVIESNSCYLLIMHEDGTHELSISYGTGKYFNERWREGKIRAFTTSDFIVEGSVTQLTFEDLMFDFKTIRNDSIVPLNKLSSDNLSLSLTQKTQTSETYTQTFNNFKVLTDTTGQHWSSISGEMVYVLQKSDTSGYIRAEDIISFSHNVTYTDDLGRNLTSTTVQPVQFPENCSYLSDGESDISVTTPSEVYGNLYFSETPKVCLSRFRFVMDDGRLFEIDQEWANR